MISASCTVYLQSLFSFQAIVISAHCFFLLVGEICRYKCLSRNEWSLGTFLLCYYKKNGGGGYRGFSCSYRILWFFFYSDSKKTAANIGFLEV